MTNSIDVLTQFVNDNSIGLTITMSRNEKKTLIRVRDIVTGLTEDGACDRNLHTELTMQKQLIELVRMK